MQYLLSHFSDSRVHFHSACIIVYTQGRAIFTQACQSTWHLVSILTDLLPAYCQLLPSDHNYYMLFKRNNKIKKKSQKKVRGEILLGMLEDFFSKIFYSVAQCLTCCWNRPSAEILFFWSNILAFLLLLL